jgi:hypothetical protein
MNTDFLEILARQFGNLIAYQMMHNPEPVGTRLPIDDLLDSLHKVEDTNVIQ